MNPWKTLNTRIVYENSWVRMREDRVIRPDGQKGIYGVLEIKPSVGIVALNDHGEIALVGQWRYAHDKFSWEIPTGSCEIEDGVMIKAAKRELREETGIEAEKWQALGTIDNSNGVTTDVAHLYLATNLTVHASDPDSDEQIVIKWIGFDNAVEMVMNGEITESSSVAAILKVDKLLR